MVERPFWLARLSAAWRKRPLVWLAGVRRTGKTTLARMVEPAAYFNCDLPSARQRLVEPEMLFRGLTAGSLVVLDEIHRLPDPSEVLKIVADEFPSLRVLATGSSSLAATRKFRDSLTGRKTVIHLPPVLWPECLDGFGPMTLERRLLRGGLPEMLLAEEFQPEWYAEWHDSFYARDVQELFGVRDRTGFLDLLRLTLRQSGGEVDYSALARECDLSRPTVKAYLEAMALAQALVAVPPFHGGSRREIVKRPKVYGFDTGFVAFARGWTTIRDEDRGPLWEHLVLDTLRATALEGGVSYWRDKAGREVDFVLPRGRSVDAVECKVRPDRFDPASLKVFREAYPRGQNLVVSPGVTEPYERRYGDLIVRITGCEQLLEAAKRN